MRKTKNPIEAFVYMAEIWGADKAKEALREMQIEVPAEVYEAAKEREKRDHKQLAEALWGGKEDA